MVVLWDRRSFLKYLGVAFGSAVLPDVLSGCVAPVDRVASLGSSLAAADAGVAGWSSVIVTRPTDFLRFEVCWSNMSRDAASGNLVPAAAGTPCYLALLFPPQSMWESLSDDGSLPNGQTNPGYGGHQSSVVGGPTQLVFVAPAGFTSLPFTLSAILEACATWDPAVSANALAVDEVPTPPPPVAATPTPTTPTTPFGAVNALRLQAAEAAAGLRQPASAYRTPPPFLPAEGVGQPLQPFETSIEIPHRLILSPNRRSAWRMPVQPVTSGISNRTELWHARLGVRRADSSVDEGDRYYRTVRALYTRDYDSTTPALYDFGTQEETQLAANRRNLVNQTAGSSFETVQVVGKLLEVTKNPTVPIAVNHLALSSLGGFFEGSMQAPAAYTLERWDHRTQMGRIAYELTATVGRLYPFGHRAILTSIIERVPAQQPSAAGGDNQYYGNLTYYQYLTLIDRALAYDDPNAATPNQALARQNPFGSVEFVAPRVMGISVTGSGWVDGGTGPNGTYLFHLVGTDRNGKRIPFETPLFFNANESGDEGARAPAWSSGPSVSMRGTRVAFAPYDGEGTTHEVETLNWTVDPSTLLPYVASANLHLPHVRCLTGDDSPGGYRFTFHSTYIAKGLSTSLNPAQLLFASSGAQAALNIASKSEQSGALVSPDIPTIQNLSSQYGLVNEASGVGTGSFNASDLFGSVGKVFGAIPLSDLVATVGLDGALAHLAPSFVAEAYDDVQRLAADLLALQTRLQDAQNTVQSVANGAYTLGTQLAVPASFTNLVAAAEAVINDLTTLNVANLTGGSVNASAGGDLGDLVGALNAILAETYAGFQVPAGIRADVARRGRALLALIGDATTYANTLAQDIQLIEQGIELAKDLQVKVEWMPLVQQVLVPPAPASTILAFNPNNPRGLLLSVVARGKARNGAPPGVDVTCSLDDFDLCLGGADTSSAAITLHFDHFIFDKEQNEKPSVDVVLKGIDFGGPLQFVETIKNLIPLDGFSDPPHIDVTPQGLDASYTMALPNLAIGVFSIENMSLSADLTVPFLGQSPLNFSFDFCTRDNPFLVTVACLGGGGYFGIELDAQNGLTEVEAAIEVGAQIAVDLGVASGSVSATAGIYFAYEVGTGVTLSGYMRLRGEVDVLGLVTMSVELDMELTYESCNPSTNTGGEVVGSATITVEVDVACFHQSVQIGCQRKFAGSNTDPIFAQLVPHTQGSTTDAWAQYCQAFAFAA